MTDIPELCFAPGSCARVPLIALEEIGQPYRLRVIAFMAGEHRKPDYLAINPSGKVPALIMTEGVLTQNPAILLYLARRHPEAGLLPATTSAFDEARLSAGLMRFSSDLHPLVTRIRIPQFFSDIPGGAADVRAKGMAAMAMQLTGIEDRLDDCPWLLGPHWSVMDAYLSWIWFRISGAGFDAEPFPNIADHARRIADRPSVQRAIAREAAAQADLEARGLAVPLN